MAADDGDENPRNEQQDNAGKSILQSMDKDQPVAGDEMFWPPATTHIQKRRRLLAVTDSLLIISYAAEKGLFLNQEDVRAILDMANVVDPSGNPVSDDQLTPELESRFWEALSRISNLIKPEVWPLFGRETTFSQPVTQGKTGPSRRLKHIINMLPGQLL